MEKTLLRLLNWPKDYALPKHEAKGGRTKRCAAVTASGPHSSREEFQLPGITVVRVRTSFNLAQQVYVPQSKT